MFKFLESRILWGSLLILGGIIFLLDNLGILKLGDLFWVLVFGLGGVLFISVFFQNRLNWWSLIPGFGLLGVAAAIGLDWIAPAIGGTWGGLFVLGSLGLSFLVIYLFDRQHWWALIPGGVLLTLGFVDLVESLLPGVETGGVFFLGLGITFGLVALLPTSQGQMKWAWIPAAVLTGMGLLMIAAVENLMAYMIPIILIGVGIVIILRSFIWRKQ
ncbi:MAG: hypothetical protein JXB15_12450 [Anaerolineales bacterium]|nr:hypothetical protein [Anaerolineales bacterium]